MSDRQKKSAPCPICGREIGGLARTVLECGHAYHNSCIHGPWRNGLRRCAGCPRGEGPRLDFGDDDYGAEKAATTWGVSPIPGSLPSRVTLTALESRFPGPKKGQEEDDGTARGFMHRFNAFVDRTTFGD